MLESWRVCPLYLSFLSYLPLLCSVLSKKFLAWYSCSLINSWAVSFLLFSSSGEFFYCKKYLALARAMARPEKSQRFQLATQKETRLFGMLERIQSRGNRLGHLRPPPHSAVHWTQTQTLILILNHALNSDPCDPRHSAFRSVQPCP